MTTTATATAPVTENEIVAIEKPKRGKRYLRRPHLADRYGCDIRNIDRMRQDGRLPPPDQWIGRVPLWDEDNPRLP
jgi:hypothetical protein